MSTDLTLRRYFQADCDRVLAAQDPRLARAHLHVMAGTVPPKVLDGIMRDLECDEAARLNEDANGWDA